VKSKWLAAILSTLMLLHAPHVTLMVHAQPVAAPPQEPAGAPAPDGGINATPSRVSYVNGEVSFWRQGASDWAPAQLNTPLAPGDVLYAGQDGAVEIQIGRAAFVRAGNDTQIGLDNQDAAYLQFRVTGGHAGVDLRQVPPGAVIELATPQAAFTVEQAGYYRLDVDQDATAFATYRGGAATMTPATGTPAPIAANQQVILTGEESPAVAIGAAPPLNAWDNWNFQRSAFLLRSPSQRYVSPAMYGTTELDQHGVWRTAETYGTVWVPSGVPAGWQPYSTGRWIWDPRFGWTWLDDAPWGWAPYHYGRWVFLGGGWGWAPGPVVVRPAYAPALVVFLGGATVGVAARPVWWAPLGWGEPVVPWWGRPGFVGVPWWGGWGGPRVVNNVVINRNTTVNVTNITTYRNVNITHAVVGVPADRFGRGQVQVTRVSQAEVQQLRPVRGALDVKPVGASMMPATGSAVRPPAAIESRSVVATRTPKDLSPALREHGLSESGERKSATRVVAAPPTRPASPAGVNAQPSPGSRRTSVEPSQPGASPRRQERGAPRGSAPGGGPTPRGHDSVQAPSNGGAGVPDGNRAAPPPGLQAKQPGPPPRAEHPKRAQHPNRPPNQEKIKGQ